MNAMHTLNGGESPISLPLVPEGRVVCETIRLGRPAWEGAPFPSSLPAFTESEIDEALSTLTEVSPNAEVIIRDPGEDAADRWNEEYR